jgi:hypothetical protein
MWNHLRIAVLGFFEYIFYIIVGGIISIPFHACNRWANVVYKNTDPFIDAWIGALYSATEVTSALILLSIWITSLCGGLAEVVTHTKRRYEDTWWEMRDER